MNNLYEWFHDDITWCGNECSNTECERNLANRLQKDGLYSAAMFKDTDMCPMKVYEWKHILGYSTAGGDPVYACGKCGKGEHVHGIEHPKKLHICPDCGAKNKYKGEKYEG